MCGDDEPTIFEQWRHVLKMRIVDLVFTDDGRDIKE
jgi:hypothetical protein